MIHFARVSPITHWSWMSKWFTCLKLEYFCGSSHFFFQKMIIWKKSNIHIRRFFPDYIVSFSVKRISFIICQRKMSEMDWLLFYSHVFFFLYFLLSGYIQRFFLLFLLEIVIRISNIKHSCLYSVSKTKATYHACKKAALNIYYYPIGSLCHKMPVQWNHQYYKR